MTTNFIPFDISTHRVVELLAKQLYQSPLALLRENTQNSFDAVRQRLQSGHTFSPRIDIKVSSNEIVVSDNGIGMTPDDLRKHYWTAGSSSKNNAVARAAGVVGTFGIGAMANFGIADKLTVETESALSGVRSICRAEKSRLSLREDCIETESVPSQGSPGTIITAFITSEGQVNVNQARSYIVDFVALIPIPVYFNGELISQRRVEDSVPAISETWRHVGNQQALSPRLRADVILIISNNGDVWISLKEMIWDGKPLTGQMVLRSSHSVMRTYRSGFGLAAAAVSSNFGFGGVADLLILEPTAGREAITVDGVQFLQTVIIDIDSYVVLILATRDECDASTPFMNWVVSHGRYDLCGRLKIAVEGRDRIQLKEIATRSASKEVLLYEGSDPAIIKMHASEDNELLLLSRTNPRRRCEQGFLQSYAKVEKITDSPVVRNRKKAQDFSYSESGVAFRVETILDTDYFVKCNVDFGQISHGLPSVAEQTSDGNVSITLNAQSSPVTLLMNLFEKEYSAFASMAKDFVRNIIFPRISDFVPSSTRQGAESFLKAIRRQRELFEYADDDLGSLPRIWEDYNEGRVTLEQAIERSKSATRSSVQVVESTARAADVVPDIIENERILQPTDAAPKLDPAPAITRLDNVASAKLLVIDPGEPAFRGYRCFVALTDKVRDEYGEFFIQPHRTSVVWGGQKTLFIFLHHSGEFGLYYDLQTREPIQIAAGGGPFETATIVLKDKIYIPVPSAISESFIPKIGERKRFDVRADILRTERR